MPNKPAPLDLNGHMEHDTDFTNEGQMDENSLCPGCKLSVVDDTGGVVVAFG